MFSKKSTYEVAEAYLLAADRVEYFGKTAPACEATGYEATRLIWDAFRTARRFKRRIGATVVALEAELQGEMLPDGNLDDIARAVTGRPITGYDLLSDLEQAPAFDPTINAMEDALTEPSKKPKGDLGHQIFNNLTARDDYWPEA